MQPEYTDEEVSERVENLNKEVPPQSHVGCEIRNRDLHAVTGCDELPNISSDEDGAADQTGESCKEASEIDEGGPRSAFVESAGLV